MKKLLLSLILVASFLVSFAQSGSVSYSGVFTRVNDSTAYITAAATKHAQGYADWFFNNQAVNPHFDIWNGSSYTHVFDFNTGSGGGGSGGTNNILRPNIKTSSFTLAATDTSSMIVLDAASDLVITLPDFSAINKGMQFAFFRKQTDSVYFAAGGQTYLTSSGNLGGVPINSYMYVYYNYIDNEFYISNGGTGSGGGGGGSGTVDTGTAGQIAVYTGSTTVDGATTGTGVVTALGVNVGTAGSVVVNGGALGTPSSGVATNLTGTAAGLTAGTVTTNANLTGDVTSTGNATAIASGVIVDADVNASAAIAGTKLANAQAGGIAATTVQAAINELDTEKANLASPTFTGTPAAPTPSPLDNSTKVATTQYVDLAVVSGGAAFIINANASPYNCTPNSSGYDNSLGIEKAIQDAFTYANAHNNTAFVQFDPGTYYITRALQTTSNAGNSGYYCQIPLPFNSGSTTNGYSTVVIKPKGDMREFVLAPGMYWNNLNNAVTFRSTLTAQTYSATYGWPSMFGGRDEKQGSVFPTHYSLMGIEFQNVTFMLPEAPTLACVNDALVTRVTYKNIQALIYKSVPANPTPEPTSPLGVFNFGPAYNNNALTYAGSNFFAGLYAGPSLVEHTVQSGQLAVADCKVAYRLGFETGRKAPFHGMQLQHVTSEGYLYGFAATNKDGIAIATGANSDYPSSSGKMTIDVQFWDIEVGSNVGVWNANVLYDFYDPGDVMTGHINYMRAKANLGAIDYASIYRFSKVGGTKLNLIDLSEPVNSYDPLSTFYDNFERAASSSVIGNVVLPGNVVWNQQAGTWGISAGKAYCSSAVSSGGATANRLVAEASASDFTYKVLVSRGTTNGTVDVIYRYSDSNNYWVVELRQNLDLRLYKKVAGTVTQIGSTYSVATITGTPYEIKVVASGSSHTVYLDGVSRITGTDAAISTNTQVGIGVSSGTGGSDNTDRFYSVELSTGTDPLDFNKLNKEFVVSKSVSSTTLAVANTLSVGTTPSAGSSGQILTSGGAGTATSWSGTFSGLLRPPAGTTTAATAPLIIMCKPLPLGLRSL